MQGSSCTSAPCALGIFQLNSRLIVICTNYIPVRQVRLGDFVELCSGEQDKDGTDTPWIMRVDELFEDVNVWAVPRCHTRSCTLHSVLHEKPLPVLHLPLHLHQSTIAYLADNCVSVVSIVGQHPACKACSLFCICLIMTKDLVHSGGTSFVTQAP